MLRAGEQRGILQLVLDVRGRESVFMDTHIDFRGDDTERLMNAAEILRSLNISRTPDDPVRGFQRYPGQPHPPGDRRGFHRRMGGRRRGRGIYYSRREAAQADRFHLGFEAPAIVPVRLWVPESEASDHLPVVGEFRLR